MATRTVVTLTRGSKGNQLGSVLIQCRVKPRVDARREGIAAVTDDAVQLNVAAQPRNGESNKAVVRIMSEALKTPKTDLRIVRGLKSRDKTIEINTSALGRTAGQDPEQWTALIEQRLAAYVSPAK